MPYTLRDLRQVIGELSQEEVDYADLQKAWTELETDKDLYDVQKERGLSYTRRQVACYEENMAVRDLSELRSFVQDRHGGEDVLFPALRELGLIRWKLMEASDTRCANLKTWILGRC